MDLDVEVITITDSEEELDEGAELLLEEMIAERKLKEKLENEKKDSRIPIELDDSNEDSDDDVVIVVLSILKAPVPVDLARNRLNSPTKRSNNFKGSKKTTTGHVISRNGVVPKVFMPTNKPSNTNSRSKGKNKARTSDKFVPLLPKPEIQDDDMSFATKIQAHSIQIRIDEIHATNLSDPTNSEDLPFEIEVSLTRGSHFRNKNTLSFCSQTVLFLPYSKDASTGVTLFIPAEPFRITVPLPPTSSVSDPNKSTFTLQVVIKFPSTPVSSICSKFHLRYRDGKDGFERISGIHEVDSQGINLAWKLIGLDQRIDMSKGLEGCLENALRMAERDEKEEIARIFEAHCLRDSRKPIIEPKMEFAEPLIPHVMPTSSYPPHIPDHPLAELFLPPSDLPSRPVRTFYHTTPLFAPLPRYLHQTFSNAAYTLETSSGTILGFPPIVNWHSEENQRSILSSLEKIQITLDNDAPDELIYDADATDSIDVGALRRDHAALKVFLEAAGIDKLRFDREELFLSDPDKISFGVVRDEEVSAILKMYETRVGRSAFDVERLGSKAGLTLHASEPESFSHYLCHFCGAPFCVLHRIDIAAANVPTLSRHKPAPVREPCGPDCWKSRDPSAYEIESEWSDFAVQHLEFTLAEFPESYSCSLSSEVERTCTEIHHRRIETDTFPTRPPTPTSTRREKEKKAKFLTVDQYYGYRPCDHKGFSCAACVPACAPGSVCDKESHCSCLTNLTACDHFCGCDSYCGNRFKGCNCTLLCEENCPCRKANRECDPTLCGCKSNELCFSSQIRNQLQISTRLGRSTIPDGGFGLFAGEDISVNNFIGLYAGEYFESEVTSTNLFIREAASEIPGNVSYWYNVGSGYATDSVLYGNHLRFINASRTNPNVQAKISYIDGTLQIAIYAIRAVAEGEELFLDYGDAYSFK